jgi:ribosomal protein L29
MSVVPNSGLQRPAAGYAWGPDSPRYRSSRPEPEPKSRQAEPAPPPAPAPRLPDVCHPAPDDHIELPKVYEAQRHGLVSFQILWRMLTEFGEREKTKLDAYVAAIFRELRDGPEAELKAEIAKLRVELAEMRANLAEARAQHGQLAHTVERLQIDKCGPRGERGPPGADGRDGPRGEKGERGNRGQRGVQVSGYRNDVSNYRIVHECYDNTGGLSSRRTMPRPKEPRSSSRSSKRGIPAPSWSLRSRRCARGDDRRLRVAIAARRVRSAAAARSRRGWTGLAEVRARL